VRNRKTVKVILTTVIKKVITVLSVDSRRQKTIGT
jgi:hypothetical protein